MSQEKEPVMNEASPENRSKGQDTVKKSAVNLHNARFELSAVSSVQFPAGGLPEAAFAGRSNVGKSSIINTLLNRKGLARVGATPGKTREINFYNIDGAFYLVDLPGYGYASVSKTQKTAWNKFIEVYLNSRSQLGLIILMVDIRHEPSADDKLMHEWILSNGAPYLAVAAKSDKLPRSQVNKRLGEIRKALGMAENALLLPFSAQTGQGREEIWQVIRHQLKV